MNLPERPFAKISLLKAIIIPILTVRLFSLNAYGETPRAMLNWGRLVGRGQTRMEAGRPAFAAPVARGRITSGFSWRRLHPVFRRTKPHLGIDFAVPVGTPVYAAEAGVVTAVLFSRSGGRIMEVTHRSGYTTRYLHLSSTAKGISRGTPVRRGQLMARAGRSGWATGPHLHFEMRLNGRPIDPLRLGLLNWSKEAGPVVVAAAGPANRSGRSPLMPAPAKLLGAGDSNGKDHDIPSRFW